MGDLAAKIAEAGPRRRRLAVSDAVFSMDGDILDLPRFLAICGANGVLSMIDEAHATGVMGATGHGLCEHYGSRVLSSEFRVSSSKPETRNEKPDILMGTLSKALGSEGGYVCASRTVCDYLRNKSRAFIFSTAHNPGSAAAADAALTILEEHPELAPRVRERAQRFVAALAAQGIAARTGSAIVPILVGDERRAVEMAAKLEARGFLVPAIRYPTVAKGAARLRVSVSARTMEDDLCALAAAIADCQREVSGFVV
jgi:7-keto-8-aminopelargonate synthetase-like enzyme